MIWLLLKEEMKETIVFWITIPIFLFVLFLFRDQQDTSNPMFVLFILFFAFGSFNFFKQQNFCKMLLTTPIPLKKWIHVAYLHNFLFLFYVSLAIFIITLYRGAFYGSVSSIAFSCYFLCIFFLLTAIKIYLDVRHDTPLAYFILILFFISIISAFYIDYLFSLSGIPLVIGWIVLVIIVVSISYYCYAQSIKQQAYLRYVVKGKIADDFVETVKAEQNEVK